MLKGFETLTVELSVHESERIVPMIMSKMLCHKGKANAITNGELIQYCGTRGQVISQPRIRKVIEYIRQKDLVPGLSANSTGYFIAENPDELELWISSMEGRRNSLNTSIRIASKTLRKMRN